MVSLARLTSGFPKTNLEGLDQLEIQGGDRILARMGAGHGNAG